MLTVPTNRLAGSTHPGARAGMPAVRRCVARSGATQAGIRRLLWACLGFAAGLAAADGSMASEPAEFAATAWMRPALLAASQDAPAGSPDPAAQEDPAAQPDGYRWRGPLDARPDWRGASRDAAYFLGYQFAGVAVLYLAPESISGWDSEAKRNYSFSKWRNNVSEPVWDTDRWWINYVLHPYWGGAYYIQARERGLERAQAFLYSALLSTIWEYGAEALAEPVSIQDLVVTPVVGSLVGEYIFSPLRERIRAKPGKLDWADKTVLFITDPLGVLNAETDRLLGVKTTLRLQPIGQRMPALGAGDAPWATRANSRSTAWGLQFSADW